MKSVIVVLTIAAVVAVLALAAVSHQSARSTGHCNGRVVIAPTPDGPMECICDAGVLATCFRPGP